ncbi:MAG: Hpt domain-containing protein [Bdellovibrionales bacterium]|nr:Hpt domain-containing protein [Bdellovibrionales bacterium]
MSFSDLMAQLQQEYILALPLRIQSMNKHLNDSQYKILADEFHKLKGTGKTYGLPEISELAEIMEKICQNKTDFTSNTVKESLLLLEEICLLRMKKKTVNLSINPHFIKIKRLFEEAESKLKKK